MREARKNETVAQRDAAYIEADFAKHVAKYEKTADGLENLTFGRPGTGICWMRFLCLNGTLYVSGDCGAAVYRAGENKNDLAWYTDTHLDYFASKCDASEYGRLGKTWDYETAEERLKEFFAGLRSKDRESRMDAYKEALGSLGTQTEWTLFLSDSGPDLFGPDWWERNGIGVCVGNSIRRHLMGLQMAMRQVRSEATPC